MWRLVRVISVESREGFTIDVHFADGTQREINLAPYLQGPIWLNVIIGGAYDKSPPAEGRISLFRYVYLRKDFLIL